eukprot:TRINITY_DN10381_c0_g1_i1.p1 TRINITY_DN10381_c0_g1~~TRINITY_DN10381_c0_g1_i1.p1  ORF type:complete len:503 (+),score=76.59 TRINITY_DN10381_c0_g1_i1:161-1669(+)
MWGLFFIFFIIFVVVLIWYRQRFCSETWDLISEFHRDHKWLSRCCDCLLFILLIYALSPWLAFNITFYAHYGHLYHKDYDFYSRQSFVERAYGKVIENDVSSCRYPHFSLAPFLNDSSSAGRHNGDDVLRIFLHRIDTHVLLHLEWLWYEILPSSPNAQHCNSAIYWDRNEYSQCLYLPEHNIAVIWISHLDSLVEATRRLPPQQHLNLFLIEDSEWIMKTVQNVRERLHLSADQLRVGAILTFSEGCIPPRLTLDSSSYYFITYGSCDLLDNDRIMMWPVGPDMNVLKAYSEHSLPPTISRMSQRKVDINLLGSLRNEKITRVQTIIEYEDVCMRYHLNCEIRVAVTLFGFLGSVDEWLGIKGTSRAIQPKFAIKDNYMEVLTGSKITLSPAGTTSECGRTMEAIITGSIPVVEEWPERYSPLFGSQYRCLPQDHYAFLKDSHAPIYWVKDWRRDLPLIVENIVNNPAALQQRQLELMQWYSRYRAHLRLIWIKQALRFFQ